MSPQPRGVIPQRRYRRRRAAAGGILALIIVIVVVVIVASSGSSKPIGYDVSYPQCKTSLPSNPLFVIVGVNDGLAKNFNPCLAKQLQFAQTSKGQIKPEQPNLSFYINTGDPGQQSNVWPKKGTAPAYGKCDGKLTDACSYLYGEQRAEASYKRVAAHTPAQAKTAPWWLDVEEVSSWAKTYELNIATLQGFIGGLHTAGATGTVGIYSTAGQWHDLTGLTASTTHTAFNTALPDWVASVATSATTAQQNCSTGGFTGEAPTLSQYILKSQDADVRCGTAK